MTEKTDITTITAVLSPLRLEALGIEVSGAEVEVEVEVPEVGEEVEVPEVGEVEVPGAEVEISEVEVRGTAN